jgi:putative lipoic acid-binding regulatory protein
MNQDKSEEFYNRLKEQLAETSKWPSNYLYKFIVPTDPEKIKQIQDIFDNTGAVIESKKSKNAKYTSLSITVNLKNPDAVIAKYKEVGEVKGVISL